MAYTARYISNFVFCKACCMCSFVSPFRRCIRPRTIQTSSQRIHLQTPIFTLVSLHPLLDIRFMYTKLIFSFKQFILGFQINRMLTRYIRTNFRNRNLTVQEQRMNIHGILPSISQRHQKEGQQVQVKKGRTRTSFWRIILNVPVLIHQS